MADSRRIKCWINTGFAGRDHFEWYPLPDGWDDLSEDEQEEILEEMAQDYRGDHIEFGAYVDDGADAS